MSAYKTIEFYADTINGDIQRIPQLFYLQCKYIKPIGVNTIKQFNISECIQAINVFIVYYEGQNLGSTRFKNSKEFSDYFINNCNDKQTCQITYNGCALTYNNCALKYVK